MDSQSIKTIYASDERGIDVGKLVKGRKRHIVVDIMGNLLSIVVHAANTHDTKSGINPAKKAFEKYPTIKKFCGDEDQDMSYMRCLFIGGGDSIMVIILNPLITYLHNRIGQVFRKNLRELTIKKLLSYPYSFYDTYQTGDIITRLT